MQGFHEVEETEEFDWFFENAKEQEITDYSSITDLKQENMDDNSIADMKREIPHKEILQNDSFTCGDIEEDGKMWKYSEGLYEAMRDVFCAVFEKLCGYGIQEVSKSISGSIEQLEKNVRSSGQAFFMKTVCVQWRTDRNGIRKRQRVLSPVCLKMGVSLPWCQTSSGGA